MPCSAIADGFNGIQIHLANHDVMLWAVSRGPLAKLQAYKRRMGWTFPWVSSAWSDFNTDYSVGFTAEEQRREGGIEYNYRREGALLASSSDNPNVWGTGVDRATFLRERPGGSAFVQEDGVIYHTYSAYARGVDALWGMWQWLDRAPKGRNETGHWWRRHDEYDSCCSSLKKEFHNRGNQSKIQLARDARQSCNTPLRDQNDDVVAGNAHWLDIVN